MKAIFLISLFLFVHTNSFGQVGIGTTTPSAKLDIVASNQATPLETDGLLIPRIDAFPLTSPTVNQQGMLVYLTTIDGTSISGFYYWDNTSISWIPISSTASIAVIDTDLDTQIQVEESADEDIIRFDMAGTEFFRMYNGRFEILNNGRSVFIGENAGANDDLSNNDNVFIGNNTGIGNTTGGANIAIGRNAYISEDDGLYNVAIGNSSLRSNSNSSYNIAIGANSGNSATGGSNVMLGHNAGYNFGVQNIAIGTSAGKDNTGNNNTFLGNEAGYSSSGSRGVFLGYQAGYTETGDDKLYIENSNSTTPLVWGDFSTDELVINGSLGVMGNYIFPTVDGTSGQILSTDGAGSVTWSDTSIGSSLEDADQDTKIQVEESTDEDIIRFDMAGTEYFRMDSGRLGVLNTGSSVFLGDNAGTNDDLSNNANTFIGTNSGASATTGYHNVSMGLNSMSNSSTAWANTTVGSYTGQSLTTGSQNTLIGYYAGNRLTTGQRNVMIGRAAGEYATGSSNIFIGNGAGRSESGSNKLYIDNSNITTPLLWGDFGTNELIVYGSLGVGGNYTFPTVDGTANQVLATDGAGNVSWNTSDKTLLEDADQDTKIQVEENTDEDIIRFDLAGTEYFRLEAGRIEFLNSTKSVFIGENSGINNDFTGPGNTAVGYNTLNTNVNGNSNTAFGSQTLQLSTADGNTAIGAYTMDGNTTGASNTALGTSALRSTTTGYQNVALGYASLNTNTTGYNNIAIGMGSGLNSTGSNNVFLGHNAGYNETGDHMLYIENSNSTTPLIWGDFSTDQLVVNGSLGVMGNYVFPITDGTSGQILSTDGSGLVSWVANTVNTNLEDTDADTKIQVEESVDEDIIRFDVAGTEYFRMDQGRLEVLNTGNSVFIGENAGENDDFTSNTNIAIGYNSLNTNSTGTANTAIGNQTLQLATGGGNTAIGAYAMDATTTGYQNTAVGNSALSSHTTGLGNVAVGANSLSTITTSSANTAVGSQALQYATGASNTAIGASAMNDVTSGTDNTALGVSALRFHNDGNSNVALGNYSMTSNTSGSKNIAIGYASGENSTGSGNVYIGSQSGQNATGDDKLYIDNTNTVTPLVYGDFSANELTINGKATINDVMNLAPRASAPTTPNQGDIYFDSTVNKLRVYDGTIWQDCW